MAAPFTGGCACGALVYSISGDPVGQTHCQCRDCQRRSGTGHSSWAVFAGVPDGVVTGPARRWSTVGEGGTRKSHLFCPTCGTPVALDFPDIPGLFAIAAGSLDDPSRFAPDQATWTASAQDWDALQPGLALHRKMPPAA